MFWSPRRQAIAPGGILPKQANGIGVVVLAHRPRHRVPYGPIRTKSKTTATIAGLPPKKRPGRSTGDPHAHTADVNARQGRLPAILVPTSDMVDWCLT